MFGIVGDGVFGCVVVVIVCVFDMWVLFVVYGDVVGDGYVLFDMLLCDSDVIMLYCLFMFVMWYLIDVYVFVWMVCWLLLINIVCGGFVDESVFVDVL